MNNTDIFDVLVVYTSAIAISASLENTITPFGNLVEYNNAYAYFLEYCQEQKLSAALITSDDIIGAGKGKAYWKRENNQWVKVLKPCYSGMIFNKFFAKNKRQKSKYDLLTSDKSIQILPKQKLVQLFTDKQHTAESLPQYTIPSVALTDRTLATIKRSLEKLQTKISDHPMSYDFSTEIILKDRFGLGGNEIYKLSKPSPSEIRKILMLHPSTQFIIQPLLICDNGYSSPTYTGYADIRLIYYGDKLIQAYVRTAKKGDFRCNMAQGGTCFYVKRKDLHPNLLAQVKQITKKINFPHSLYALDFLISNAGNVYFIEGNSSPGLYWTVGVKQEEDETKKLIHILVHELADRINAQQHITQIKVPTHIYTTTISEKVTSQEDTLVSIN